MLAAHYVVILHLHVSCVILSGALFTVRGVLRIGNHAVANHPWVRATSYVIDTVLLVAAIALTLIVRQYPFVNAWLTVKVLLLVVYIVLGTVALKRAQTGSGRTVALTAALLTFGFMLGVAITHQPSGWLTLLR